MLYVEIVLALALLQFIFFGMAVGRARGLYKCPAPATTGNEMFERYFRVQMNTLEQLVVFVPAIVLFALWELGKLIARRRSEGGHVAASAAASI